jgi:hypothetical protein
MYVMYCALMLQCWQLIRILVRTNHPCLRVGRHTGCHGRSHEYVASGRGRDCRRFFINMRAKASSMIRQP